MRQKCPGIDKSAIGFLLIAVITFTLTFFGGATGAAKSSVKGRHVLVLSIDGLDSRYISQRDEFGLKIPTLRGLIAGGAAASGVIGVYPTLTYPSHTSIVTGARPIKHGIFGNDVSGPGDANGLMDGIWFARSIQAQTLWDAAHLAGLKVGLVSWPVAAGAGDYNVPEMWKPGGKLQDSLKVIETNAIPAGLVSEIRQADPDLYKESSEDEGDDARSRSAAYIVEKKRPDLMLVHLIDLDHFEHKDGPFTPPAFGILEKIDGYVARILDAYRRSGTLDQTTVFIVSDHGFMPVSKQINPGVLLVKNDLIHIKQVQGANGKPRTAVVDWKAYPYPTAGSCAILLSDPNDTATLKAVRAIFEPLKGNGIESVFDRNEIKKLGANPNAAVMLEAAPGYYFASRMTGEFIADGTQKGTHGYLPTKYQTSLIVNGDGIGRRGSLGVVKMIDLGPTIAGFLGLKLKDAEGKPISLR